MKIITSVWATNFTTASMNMGTVGFVLIETDEGEQRLYVGIGQGKDEQEDEQHIASWGTRIEDGNPIYKLIYLVARSMLTNSQLIVTSGYGANTKLPFVQLESPILDRPMQFSPEEARSIAKDLIESAEFAESESFIVGFFRDHMDADNKMTSALLVAFRKWRNDHREDPLSSSPLEDV